MSEFLIDNCIVVHAETLEQANLMADEITAEVRELRLVQTMNVLHIEEARVSEPPAPTTPVVRPPAAPNNGGKGVKKWAEKTPKVRP